MVDSKAYPTDQKLVQMMNKLTRCFHWRQTLGVKMDKNEVSELREWLVNDMPAKAIKQEVLARAVRLGVLANVVAHRRGNISAYNNPTRYMVHPMVQIQPKMSTMSGMTDGDNIGLDVAKVMLRRLIVLPLTNIVLPDVPDPTHVKLFSQPSTNMYAEYANLSLIHI